MYCKLAKDTCLVNISYYQLCWGRWMTGCDRQGPKRINLLKQKLDVFGAMKRHLGGNSLGRLTSWTLHGGSQWSQPWIFTAFATHECHNHSARLHAWLVDSWVRNLWRRQLEFIGPLFFFHMTITSRCRFGFIQLKLVKAVGPELGKFFTFFEKSTSLDSFDSTEALPLCAASLWRCHGGTGYALERGKAAMAGNTWKATLPGRCYLSFWVETLMQMKAHPSWENIGFHDVFDVPFQYMPIFLASMPSFSSSTTCSTGGKNYFIDPGAFWEKIEGVEFCRGESVVLRWFWRFWIFEAFDLEAKMI